MRQASRSSAARSWDNHMRVAVIGVGHLGRHHARILAGMPGVDLVGVVDTNLQRAREIADAHGTTVVEDAASLVGVVDAVVVATPTASHAAVAAPFLDAGTAVLVEKPLARSLEEADSLVARARARGATLAVGHTERFNPAVEIARPLLDRAAVHRGAPAWHVPGSQPGHRRRVRPDDSRHRRRAVGGQVARWRASTPSACPC